MEIVMSESHSNTITSDSAESQSFTQSNLQIGGFDGHRRPLNPAFGIGSISRSAWGYVFVVLAVLLWAGNATVGRLAPESNVPPLALNFWRWMIAFFILLPVAWPKLKLQRALLMEHWKLVTLFGVTSVAGFNSALYIGLQYTTVVQGTLISAALPIFVLLGARILLSQPVIARQIVGVVISILGIAITVVRGDLSILGRMVLNIGDLWVLLAVCMWAAQTILVRLVPKNMDLIAFQIASFVVGLTALVPFYLHETMSGRPMPVTWNAALLVGYAGVAASVIGFTCWNLGVMRIGPQTAGYFGNLFPVFGAMLGVLLLGETFAWYHALGGALTLTGIYLATAIKKNRGKIIE
jgi:drug/metabolite transporter (DMT)-like permease